MGRDAAYKQDSTRRPLHGPRTRARSHIGVWRTPTLPQAVQLAGVGAGGSARGGERHGRGRAHEALEEHPVAQASGLAGRRGAPAGSLTSGQVDAQLLHIAALPRVEISALPGTASARVRSQQARLIPQAKAGG